MTTEAATPSKSKGKAVPPPTLPPEQLNQILGALQPVLEEIGKSGGTEKQIQGLYDAVATQVAQKTGAEVFRAEYPYFDQAQYLFPHVIGGGAKGTSLMLKDNEAAKAAFKPISSGIAYARSRELCYAGRVVNWAAETNVLGDVMYVLAAIGAVGGLIFLGRWAYNAWIA
jgi:hypothetical protein